MTDAPRPDRPTYDDSVDDDVRWADDSGSPGGTPEVATTGQAAEAGTGSSGTEPGASATWTSPVGGSSGDQQPTATATATGPTAYAGPADPDVARYRDAIRAYEHDHSGDTLRFLVDRAFAALVILSAFYGLVLYEFALPEITQGALISLATLAANSVFGEGLTRFIARRERSGYEKGQTSSTEGTQ